MSQEFYEAPDATMYVGDVSETLREMPPASVQCVVTSPPYWGLRDYGTATWEGGDDDDDDHAHAGKEQLTAAPGSGMQAGNNGANYVASGDCVCGAVRIDDQLGLEPTPEAYVERMVAVFAEVRRVLRDDGTLWLNLGDSYARGSFRGGGSTSFAQSNNLKPKDLVGIPWRVALALQAAGWWLRSDIIWSKPYLMPESVTDRPTHSHEYLFLLTKSARYYYDAAAIAESSIRAGETVTAATRNKRTVWEIAPQSHSKAHFATFPEALVRPCVLAGSKQNDVILDPFGGSGTVAVVTRKLGRKSIYIDLNEEYAKMAKKRLEGVTMPMAI